MKTLEITTESGTYLILDLPDVSKDAKLLPIFQSSLVNDIKELVTYKVNGKVEFSDIYLPFSNWQLIGPGKDHHELVEELGLLSERMSLKLSTGAYVDAQDRIFKNPFILKRND